MISKHAKDAVGGRASTSVKYPPCFLHVPKSGGSSVHAALLAALPEGSLSVKSKDTSNVCFGFTAFDELGHEARRSLLVEECEFDALSRSKVVFGHFCMPTLLRIAPPRSIATVLREPRARLLSLYASARLTPGQYEAWNPYRPDRHALRPLDEYLSEPQIAPEVDNAVCRMLLYSDPRIPALDFISSDHIESLASDAIDLLDQFGFVGVLEREHTTWEGLSRFFSATLRPARERVTGSAGVVADALPLQNPISDRTLDLLEARTAADTLIYTHALMSESTEADAKQIRNSTFAAQLVRLGDIGGNSAALVQALAHRVGEAESRVTDLQEKLRTGQEELNERQEALTKLEADLASHRMWLQGIKESVSWRVTAPLRAAKRRVRE
jgi:hypothetical protein